MNKSDRHLDEYFAKARIEPPVITEEEILTALDEGSLPGQQFPHPEQLTHNSLRGKIMKGVVVGIIAGSLGWSALYFINNSATSEAKHSIASVSVTTPDKAGNAPAQAIVRAPEFTTRNIVAPVATKVSVKSKRVTYPSVKQGTNTPNDNGFNNNEIKKVDDGLDSALARQLGTEMSKIAADYWITKINNYKVRIDRMLSTSDLNELNKLRVRAGIMMKSGGDTDGTVSFSVSNDPKAKVHMSAKANGKEVSEQDGANGIMEGIQAMMSRGEGEPLKIYNGVKEISGRHRTDLNGLKNDLFDDLSTFMEMMSSRGQSFMEEHRNEISKEKFDTLSAHFKEAHDKLNAAELKTSMGMIYGLIGEPLLMLYNGSDIGSLIPSALTAPVPGMKIAENMTLKQSFPNPASSSATIGYSLSERSNSAVLRIYDASGNVVATFDQGAQSAGEHSVPVDLSKLASGTYLYHLTIQTSKGEQVFSKTLQVAR